MTTWSQAQIDALKAAIASGTLNVSFADQSTTFQSLKDMRELLAEMERSVVGGGQTYRLASISKGV